MSRTRSDNGRAKLRGPSETKSCLFRQVANPDGLGVCKFADAIRAKLTAVAGGLYAAKRYAGIARDHLVDEDHTGLKIVDELLALARIIGPGARTETEAAVIGDGDGFLDVLDAKQAGHRAEEFFAIGWRILRDMREPVWRIKIALTAKRFAARQHFGASLHAFLHVAVEILHRVRCGERTDI